MTTTSHDDHPLVAITWDDAHGSSTQDINANHLDAIHLPIIMTTVGWLIKQDEVGFTLSGEWCVVDGDYRGHTFIPFDMVKNIRVLTKQMLSQRPVIYDRDEEI